MNAQSREHGIVVVGVDGSDRGYAGVQYAAQEAQRLEVALDIVHVSPGYLPVGPLLVIPDGSLQSYATTVLERATATAFETAPGVEVDTHHLRGARIDGLVTFSDGAALLVLASRHLSVLERVWTGATVTGVVARATCPTVVVPSSWEPTVARGRIVVGFQTLQHATELLAAAFALASTLDAELEVLHAWKLPGVYDDMIASGVEEEQTNVRELDRIEPLLGDLRKAHPEVKAYARVVHRRAAAALVGASSRADRILIGKPIHGGRFHHLGSTARTLLRHAECPVEVVPSPGGADDTPGLVLERGGELLPTVG
jgi:nucleotide-binding universal stress UspA family protein